MKIYRIGIEASARSFNVTITDNETIWVKPDGEEIKVITGMAVEKFSVGDKKITFSSSEKAGINITIFVKTTRRELPIKVSHTGTEFYIESDADRSDNLVQGENDYLLPLVRS